MKPIDKMFAKILASELDALGDNPPGMPGEKRVLRRYLKFAFNLGRSWDEGINALVGGTRKVWDDCEAAYIEAECDFEKALKALGGPVDG